MAYTINLTNGNVFATIADGTINTSSSMTLIGKNYAGYGQFLDDNFIHLLENGANSTAPGAPLTGQLWFDTSTGLLKVYNGTVFKAISAATSSSTAPSGATSVQGDLWYDTTNAQLNVYTGTAWLLVGPQFTAGQGTSGAIVDTITDNIGNSHTVIKFYAANAVVGIVSNDSTFTPQTPISGFANVRPGITLATGGNTALFAGTATNSQQLNSLTSSQFMRSDDNTSTTGTLGVLNNTGLTVGSNQDFKASVSGTAVTVSNQTSNGNLNISVNVGGTPTNAISINGSTGVVTIPSLASNISGGNLSVQNLTNAGSNATGSIGNVTGFFGNVYSANIVVSNILNAGANATGNIGNSSSYFNTIFAQATSAAYADVAERFASDTEYEAGTVVELGGSAEITKVQEELSDSVFGVISTRAAYLMNSQAGTDATHPPVAMTGRVPVKVIGQVHKGDRLVSAGNGIARKAQPGEATAFNVIGRALTNKLDTAEGLVEAIVRINN